MHTRATELVRDLALQPHPEGGYFREVYRSTAMVQPDDERPARNALTTIYFLLTAGMHSRWHRVASDEVWHFHEGDPLELWWIEGDRVYSEILFTAGNDAAPVRVVRAGCWQAARPLGSYTLVGCTVGPGFDFADFEMIAPETPAWAELHAIADLPPGLT